MEISSSSIASSILRSPPSTFVPFLSYSPSPSRLKRLTSSSASAISITRESNSLPPPQSHHSEPYLARQAAVLQVQQSPDLHSALQRYGGVLKVQDLNSILRYLGKLNRFKDLSKLFEWMQQHGEISASSYTSYIKLIGKSHNPLKALETYSGISDQTMKVNVFICNAVLSCLVRNGKFDTSIKLFQQMKKDGLIPDVITYSMLLSGCMKVKNGYSKALELVHELDCSGLQMDGVVFGTLLAVCASHNQCEEAEKYFQRMKDEGHTPNEFHYSSLLNAYSADGNYKKAEELVQDMKSTGLKPNKVILTTLLKVYVRGGLFEKSAELLAELESIGYADDEIAYCLVMDGLAKSGRIDEARSVFKAMTEKSVKSDGYAHSIMLSAFFRDGLVDEAKLLARDFETKYNRYDLAILNAMLRAYCRAGEMESVMQTLRKLDELAISPDYNTFHILIKYFSKEKLYLLAFKTMEDMHSKGHQPEEELCSSLIFHLGKMNAHMEAFSVYKMLKYGKKTMCKALHEKILHILIAGRLYKEAYVVVKDNVELISKPAMNKFAANFMKSGNVNLINDVLKVVHASGNKIKQEIFQMGISRLIVVPQKKDLLVQLLQWMAGQGYAVKLTTRDFILKNSQFLDGDLIKDILSKHKQISKATAALPKPKKKPNVTAALPKPKKKPNVKRNFK